MKCEAKLIRLCLLSPHICPEDKQAPINKSAVFIFFKYPLKRKKKAGFDLGPVGSCAEFDSADQISNWKTEMGKIKKTKSEMNGTTGTSWKYGVLAK